MEKLTEAQRLFLIDCAHGEPYAVNDYRPAVALLRLKLIDRREGAFGSRWFITEAGRTALKEWTNPNVQQSPEEPGLGRGHD